MEKQNVTLALPKEILRKAKAIAAQRDSSLSALLTQALNEMVMADERYAVAAARHIDQLETAPNLGGGGRTAWTREESHDR
jgi:predicted transcriptional regulator